MTHRHVVRRPGMSFCLVLTALSLVWGGLLVAYVLVRILW